MNCLVQYLFINFPSYNTSKRLIISSKSVRCILNLFIFWLRRYWTSICFSIKSILYYLMCVVLYWVIFFILLWNIIWDTLNISAVCYWLSFLINIWIIWIIKRILSSWEDCDMVKVDNNGLKKLDCEAPKSGRWGDMDGEVVNHVI